MHQVAANPNTELHPKRTPGKDTEIITKLKNFGLFEYIGEPIDNQVGKQVDKQTSQDASDEQLKRWATKFSLRKCKAGTVIVDSNTPHECIYLLHTGKAWMQAMDHSGKSVSLQTLKPGQMFGDWAALGALGKTGSVIAQDNCVMLMASKRDFMEILAQSPACAFAYIQALALQLQNLTYLVSGFLSLKAPLRVHAVLLEQATAGSEGLLIHDMPTHSMLASMAHTQREVVAREMSSLYKQGILVKTSSAVVIIKPDLLCSNSSARSGTQSKPLD